MVIASLNSAREKAKTAAIKAEARQLFTLAMEHYAETGDFTTFSSYGWTRGDSQTGLNTVTCSTRIGANAVNRGRAIEICNSLMSKLPTNISDGSAANKMLMSCNSSYCNTTNQYSVQVKLSDNAYQSGSPAGNWYCIGSSGATTEGLYNLLASGCALNP